MSKNLWITRGLPGSGKTSWAQKMIAAGDADVRVNRDDIRMYQMGYEGVGTHEQERLVTEIQLTTVRKYLRWDRNVIVDDTNLKLSVARDWADVALECGAEFGVVDFTQITWMECVRRVESRYANRGRYVPAEVIKNMYDRYLAAGPLEAVTPRTKEADLTTKYVPDTYQRTAFIFDIDGTLAEMSGRSPYDWKRVKEDTVKEDVRAILWSLQDGGNDIIIVSGRDGECYDLTAEWLADNEITYDAFYMRPAGDNRKDSLVKAEIFWRDIAPKWWIQGVFDDRNSVVEMWRDLGLTCCQVAEGDF